MRHSSFYLCGLFGLLVGCFRPAVPVTQPLHVEPTKSTSPVKFVVSVRPMIITSRGTTYWTAERLQERFTHLNQAYAPVGLQWNVLPPLTHEQPELLDFDARGETSDAVAGKALCEQWATDAKELLVVFVHRIVLSDVGDVGGAAWYPPSHGIFVAYFSQKTVVTHELGHALGLSHYVPLEDCANAVHRCNPMSYCNRVCDTSFTTQQAEVVARTLMSNPRRSLVTFMDKSLQSAKMDPPRTATGELATCGF